MKIVLLFLSLLAASSEAAIITGVIPEAQRLFGAGQRPFDFDGDGYTDLTFTGNSLDFQFLRVVPSGVPLSDGTVLHTSFFIVTLDSNPLELAVLPYGTLVSGASEGYTGFNGNGAPLQISSLYAGGQGVVHDGPWAGQSGYLGFAFWTLGGPAHYAWFRMAESGGVLELYEWAYETQDNTPIIAGHVPEPSLAALLAVPFVVFMGRRSRLRGAGLS